MAESAILVGLAGSMGGGEMSLSFGQNPLITMCLCFAMAMVPFLMLGLTSFIKFSVVFGILRNALGAGQIPSAAISGLLAFVLTLQIMGPVIREGGIRFQSSWSSFGAKVTGGKKNGTQTLSAEANISRLFAALSDASRPFQRFLERHSRMRERVFFAGLSELQNSKKGGELRSKQVRRSLVRAEVKCKKEVLDHSTSVKQEVCLVPGESFFSLVPAFVLSELREAFAIGFTIFLPFLVIDLVVANILVGLGMMMVSPVTISLPFKIVLFVVCDGWFLLCKGLLLGYL